MNLAAVADDGLPGGVLPDVHRVAADLADPHQGVVVVPNHVGRVVAFRSVVLLVGGEGEVGELVAPVEGLPADRAEVGSAVSPGHDWAPAEGIVPRWPTTAQKPAHTVTS